MAILSKKPKKEPKAVKKENSTPSTSSSAHILLRPRVTEKASESAMNKNVYVFDVAKSTTKEDVRKAIVEFYKVSPLKIAMVKVPSKQVFVRGKYGTRGSGKKTYVYLKKGDKIEIV
jgi:large subunit ribosomal protein L23